MTRCTAKLVALLFVVVLAGCGGSGRIRYDSPQEAFEKGKAFYDRGKYDRAIEYLQASFNYGRAHEWAADAQLYLARSYYGNGEYILAANEYSRFSQLYRSDPRRAEAEYERAMAYYEMSPPYQMDQTDTQRAVNEFRMFIERYPDSPLVADAEARITELREKMARKEVAAAELYERRELYEAAAITYENAFDRYPDTSWADDALLGASRSYVASSAESVVERQPERLRSAIANYERLVQIFPDSPLIKEAEALYREASSRLEVLAEQV